MKTYPLFKRLFAGVFCVASCMVPHADVSSYDLTVVEEPAGGINPEDMKFLRKMDRIIEELMSNPDLNVDRLCRELGISHTALFTKVKQASGKNIKEYINDKRIQKAIDLMLDPELNFMDISEKTGFTSSRYFSTFFKTKTGLTPSEYRKSLKS